MDGILDILCWVLVLIGGAFGIIGGIGIVRMPTFFTRIHAAGMAETMCAPPILLAMMIQAGWSLITFKLFLIMMFLFLTSPTASHALAKAALHGGVTPHNKDAGES
jgi:multicomponent Na+:H+ antiporter subunit G